MKVILVIDDDVSFLEIIDAQLASNQFRVFTAATGAEGLKTANSLNPDLVICDVKMPGMDGFEVLKRLRKDRVTERVPVIMLSAITNREAVYACMRYNIMDYIIKPYKPELLIKKINIAIHYNEIKKGESISKKGEHVLISRSPDTVIISFNIKLNTKNIIAEVKNVFSPFFLKSLVNKKCILDLRSLSGFDEGDAKVLGAIIQLFKKRELLIVAGRHYGDIVSIINFDDDFGERINLFISFGDMELYLKK